MEKDRIIKDIHNILYTFELEDYDNYYAVLSHQIIKLSASENDVIKDNVKLLKGLRNMGKDVIHYDVRHTVLHIMNDISRRI